MSIQERRFVWGNPFVVVSDPKLFKTIFGAATFKRFGKDQWSYEFFRPILGRGLVTSHGKAWRKRKTAISPHLAPVQMSEMMPVFNEAAGRLCDVWKQGVKRVELDLTFRKVTLEVISEITLGWSPEKAAVFPTLFSEIIDELNQRMFQPWRAYMPLEWEHQRRLRNLNALVEQIIQGRKDEYTKEGYAKGLVARQQAGENTAEVSGLKPPLCGRASVDILDALLHADFEMPREQVSDELKTMLLAGHETSSMMLTWALFLLIKYPAEMAKAQAAVDAVCGDKARFGPGGAPRGGTIPFERDDVSKMAFLNWALQEGMRIFVPVPTLARVNHQEEDFNGHKIPANTQILISVLSSHRDPKIWGPSVGDFRPERMAPEKEQPEDLRIEPEFRRLREYCFLPFSVGPRDCIGRHLAVHEGVVVLAHLLHNFDFELADGQTSDVNMDCYIIPVRPEGGIYIKVSPRKHRAGRSEDETAAKAAAARPATSKSGTSAQS